MRLGDPEVDRMRGLAEAACRRAYAPYSGLHVGAAVMVEGGELFAGCNVENASYSLTICAERNALFQAVSTGHRRLLAVALYSDTPVPLVPCGACRQVLAEFGPDCDVFCFSPVAAPAHFQLSELLPVPFSLRSHR